MSKPIATTAPFHGPAGTYLKYRLGRKSEVAEGSSSENNYVNRAHGSGLRTHHLGQQGWEGSLIILSGGLHCSHMWRRRPSFRAWPETWKLIVPRLRDS